MTLLPPLSPHRLWPWLVAASPDQALAGVAELLAAACIGWVGVASALVLLARLPGLTGRAADLVGTRVVPTSMRRAIEAVLGISIATVPVVVPIAGPGVAPALADHGRPAPSWSPPLLDRPVAARQPATVLRPRQPTSYRVRSGDCLWTIAARHEGQRPSIAAVAAAWPRWYAANERVIGPDPNVITPGQHLAVPIGAMEVSP